MSAPLRLLLAALVTGTMLALSGAALAGSCPADQLVADGQGQRPSNAAAKAATDTLLASIDLADQPVGVPDRQFRMRRVALKPGGIVPWHSHDDRPALIYVAIGEVTEYASNCAAPIVHHPGEVGVEVRGTSHWWRNTGPGTAVLISADLLRQADDAHAM